MSDKPLKNAEDERPAKAQDEGDVYLFPATATDVACAVRATSIEDAQKQAAAIRSKSTSSISQ